MSDLIKRLDAIDELYRLTNYSDMPHDWHVGVSASISALHRVPSADRPQGEWILQEDDDIYNCSECEFEIDATGCIDPTEYVEIYNYCPNCGARMKGADDEYDK